MTQRLTRLTAAILTLPSLSLADETRTQTAAPEGHAPIMVMGDHMHQAGEYMFSLRQMNMRMTGNISGTNKLSDAQVLGQPNDNAMMPANLRVVPQKMDMAMTMLGAMYAPNDTITLLAMNA